MQVIRSIRNLTLIALLTCASVRIFLADFRRGSDHHGSPGTAGLRAAALPATKLHVDSWILGMGWSRRLLLGSGNVDDGSCCGPAVDPRLLGLE